ncbi:MAG: DNA primase small subunit domain-containing protein [archaeon]
MGLNENANEQGFLRKKFQEFYAGNEINYPTKVANREFGIGEFGKKIVKRHMAFSNPNFFNAFLKEDVPFYVSASASLYKMPDARPMDKKEIIGSELIYEFDADDIKTDCRNQHDSWRCTQCNASGSGTVEKCTSCGSNSLQLDQWFCPECLNETKKQVFNLVDILQEDFGIAEGLYINFSGNAGFHVHVENQAVEKLSKEARIQLLDYLTLHEINLELLGFFLEKKTFVCPKDPTFGQIKRIKNSLRILLKTADIGELATYGLVQKSKLKSVLKNKDLVLEGLSSGTLFSIDAGAESNKKFWHNILNHIVSSIALDIDRQTSSDIYKLVRVPNTLHGGTGLIAKVLPIDSLDKFDALKDTVAFSDGRTNVYITKVPRFYLYGNYFGPYEDTQVELPDYAAIYLIAKGKARLV